MLPTIAIAIASPDYPHHHCEQRNHHPTKNSPQQTVAGSLALINEMGLTIPKASGGGWILRGPGDTFIIVVCRNKNKRVYEQGRVAAKITQRVVEW